MASPPVPAHKKGKVIDCLKEPDMALYFKLDPQLFVSVLAKENYATVIDVAIAGVFIALGVILIFIKKK